MDATGQAELVRSGQVTALELLEAAIDRIEVDDPRINAVVMRGLIKSGAPRSASCLAVCSGVFRSC
jgi:Asp-tRNA(Asn)/Glu-tRNA(Gln) amidotransferase A subunit family amidase